MRGICTLLFLLFSIVGQAQKLKGIWRGYFVQKEFNQITGKFMEDKYKFEVQVNQLQNNALEGVTYSYKTIVFYGKASFKGIYTKATQNILLKELKMLELKISNNAEPCLMTCYLDYKKEGKLETLSGTYTSLNSEKKSDCGEGSVYLEKVPESDFELEPFLVQGLRKKTIEPKKDTITIKKSAVQNHSITPTKPTNTTASKNTNAAKPNTSKPSNTPKIKPGAEAFVVANDKTINDTITSTKLKPVDTVKKQSPQLPQAVIATIIPKPKVLLERENKLVNTIIVDVPDVRIDYYDNGQIDNDTITVYLNNEKIISSQKLDYTPLTINLHFSDTHISDEIITIADNLGDEPPNTALMVITAGKKRYEVSIVSDEKNNAKVIIEYKPQGIKVH
jgi:hypothetical protein